MPLDYFGEPVVPEIRRIWVQRNGFIEYKVWFIFSWDITVEALGRLTAFLKVENRRFRDTEVTPQRLNRAAEKYSSLTVTLPELPPRLITIADSNLARMGTQLVTEGRITYGDSVGGLAPSSTNEVNPQLRQQLRPHDEVLFSPGVLARLRCELHDQTCYLFQLAAKNFRRSGAIFYKAIGGHLKFLPSFDTVIEDLGLKVKTSGRSQGDRDVVFRVRGDRLAAVIDLFENETITTGSEHFFVHPARSMYQELREELGPVNADDGINLFSDRELRQDFVRAKGRTGKYFIYPDNSSTNKT